MPQLSPEKYLVRPFSPRQMRDSDIIIKDQDGNSDSLEVSSDLHAYTNSELVNYENAAVNIDSSTDVIIGPVTQFNVNGNVTIVQNGSVEGEEKEKEKTVLEQKFPEKCDNAKLPKAEKSLSEEQDVKCVFQRKTIIRIAVISFISFLVICGILALIIILVKAESKRDRMADSSHDSVTDIEYHAVFTRRDWGGFAPKSVKNFTAPVRLVIIKHVGAGEICEYFETCCKRLQSIQSNNMAKNLSDIYCNFFIGGDGNIYVGRGWDAQPAYKQDTIDIVFSGNFDVFEPSDVMIDAAQALLREGVAKKKLAPDYVVVPHNQTMNTQSPGLNLIKKIHTWPHYDKRLFFHNTLPMVSNATKP